MHLTRMEGTWDMGHGERWELTVSHKGLLWSFCDLPFVVVLAATGGSVHVHRNAVNGLEPLGRPAGPSEADIAH